ncbi:MULTISPECIES: D-alanyl-D-alanine carboxypeptidase family protein [Rhodanobacter]|uniref:D-alanyl-D-alanine carboxypeptidase/D-alanyl-D-alanine carboxypeptidase (Penicillin-binding protein 5/6) n=1 Tax=Rhodanobacter glycinis TaxID=582702 RepID=A0A1I4DY49_9GAMM|nr:D-alanyl-D-alanine carboxypeptidase family protein [Rhodanobacter glycinis]SFK97056.1 D-alanyl-D-alanine carboxypeptidase/D-alanyl-D-alanine carboxypeptidase (penicillin-binding protein 5/6) [Rhodanobacter glycinis]
MSIGSRVWLRATGGMRGALLSLLCMLGLGAFAGQAHAGYAAIVVDASTGKVLEQVNADQRNYPASLTKMMTLYFAFQGLKSGRLKLDQQLPVSAWAASRAPTKLGLRRGETISLRDCILGIVTKSANDAATVVAEAIGGSEPHFAEMMNAQAALLGMDGTHFDNASGLPDPRNVSTAHDLVRLSMALYRDFPQYAHFFATREFTFRGHIVRGHNRLMYRYPGMDGLKTGFTDASGFNLASTAVRNGHRLFGVVLGSRTAAIRDDLMAKLLDDGFEGRSTSPELVAAAAGERGTSRALHILEELSPIPAAEAHPVPGMPMHRRRRAHAHHVQVAAVSRACKRHHSVAECRRIAARHAKKHSVRLASRHRSHRPVEVASRRDTDG